MAYTRKQQAALARVRAGQRGKLAAMFRAQRMKQRSNGGNKTATRSMAEIVLAPGVGRVPRNPFGSARGMSLRCWDAFDSAHAPLPRSIGPYAVVRTTRIFQSNKRVNVFGVTKNPISSDSTNVWSNVICFQSNNTSNPINDTNNTDIKTIPIPGGTIDEDSTLSCVPAAISVQVMNPNSLQTTSGIVYAAVCPTQLNLCNNTRSWEDFEDEFTSYMKPRLLSAPKLALRGVQMNSYPLNMSTLSQFDKVIKYGDQPITWASGIPETSLLSLDGLAPMVVVNRNGANLTYCVSVEWRVRFDIGNPAVSSHKHHGITPDSVWDNMVRAATSLGNGVRDIAEVVATAGQAASAVRHAALPVPLVD